MTNLFSKLRRLVCVAISLASLTSVAGTVTYYHNDLLGSPIAATNASGQVIWRENYRPYGERLTNDANSSANRVWFTSRRQDAETGLVYMGARYYDPAVGRFMGRDPKLFDETNAHSLNRYAYANNNPQKFVDPDGRMAQWVARGVYYVSYEAATAVGAGALGSLIGVGLYNWTHTESTENSEKKTDAPKADPQSGGSKEGPQDDDKAGNREKDVPDRAEPGAVVEGNKRTREYNSEGNPLRDYDKPHQGFEEHHVHEWSDGKREHPGRPYSPLPKDAE